MRKYLTIYRIGLQDAFAYRAPIIIWLLGNILSFVLMVSVWLSAESASGLIAGYRKLGLITYFLLGFILNLVFNWLAFHSISRKIADGSVVGSMLLKPVSCFLSELFGNAGWRTIFIGLGLFIFLIGGYLFRNLIELPSINNLLVATPSIVLTILVTFSFSLCLGLVAFWTTHTSAIDSLFWIGRLFVGGQAIPISFFPEYWKNLVNLLPFRYTYGFSLEILTGRLMTPEIIFGYIIQIFWLACFLIIYKLVWNAGRKSYSSFGQ